MSMPYHKRNAIRIFATTLFIFALLYPIHCVFADDTPFQDFSDQDGTIIFGLLFSTLAPLVFIPAFYGVPFDRKPKKKEVLIDNAIS